MGPWASWGGKGRWRLMLIFPACQGEGKCSRGLSAFIGQHSLLFLSVGGPRAPCDPWGLLLSQETRSGLPNVLRLGHSSTAGPAHQQ